MSDSLKGGFWSRVLAVLDSGIKGAVVIFMLLPVALVVLLSFSNEPNLTFPPKEWGLNQYEALWNSEFWKGAIARSFAVSIPTALVATAVGVPAALALERSRMRGKSFLWALGIAPLILPGVAYAVALYTFVNDTGLIATYWGVILAETMLALPFVILITSAGLRRIPRDLELVAMSLGASSMRATVGITVRLLMPSILAAMLLSFVVTFDEAVLVTFVGGGEIITLPKATYDSVRDGLDPVITAIASMLILFTGVLILLSRFLRKNDGEEV